MFENLNQIRKARKKFNLKMFRSGVNTFRELEELEANAFRDGVIEQRHKEFIALGISISRAAELGASRKEILEATAVALALGGGLAQWPARFVFKVFEELEHQEKDNVEPTTV